MEWKWNVFENFNASNNCMDFSLRINPFGEASSHPFAFPYPSKSVHCMCTDYVLYKIGVIGENNFLLLLYF